MLNDKLQKGQAFRLFTTSIGAMLVASILIVLLNPLLGFYDETGTYSYGGFWWANVISQAVLIVAVVVFCRVVKVDYFQAVALKNKPNPWVLLCALGVGVGVFCFMNPIQMWILRAFEYFGYLPQSNVPISNDATTVILLVLVVGLLPAFAEEQLFRGAITGGLKSLGLIPACLVGGALFMIFHMNPAQTVHQFVMGFVLSLLALKSDSLYPTVLVHFVNNIAVILLALIMGEQNANELIYEYWYLFLIVGLLIAGLSLWGFLKLTKNNDVQKQPTEQAVSTNSKVLDAEQIKTETKGKNTSDLMILFAGVLACVVMWLTNLSSNIGG